MDGDTLRSRVVQLVQRTRKAVRLYSSTVQSSGGRLTGGDQGEFTSLQLEQWQQVNTELQRQLSTSVDHPNQKLLAGELLAIRDRFYHEWRNAEAEVHQKQGELLASGEKGDFVRSAIVARALVTTKAREQAAQAAHHELQELIDRAKIDPSASQERMAALEQSEPILLEKVEEAPAKPASPQLAKVIPLRRQGF